MKRTKHILLTIALLLSSLAVSAHDFEVGGIYYNITSDDDLTVAVTYKGNNFTSYSNEYSGAVTIPSTIAYNGKTYSVTSIGDHAFSACRNLTAINIPASVTSIEGDAFYDCLNLKNITIPESVTSIGGYAFSYCNSLTSITIPASVTSIGIGAFSSCSSLTAVHVSSIESWCNIDFDNIDSNPLYIAKNLYLNGELVTELVIPEGVTSIGEWAFEYCSSLTDITIPEGVMSIGRGAFSGCSSLTTVTIPTSVTSIERSTFCDCSSLTAITLPENVTSIGGYAFCDCSSLTAITLPEGVTSIGEMAFYGCSSLASITCKATTPPTISYSHTFYNVDKSIPVYVYTGSVEAYQSAGYWNKFTNIIGIENLKCATPTISYQDGQFALTCDTEGAEVITHAAIEGEDTFHGLEFEFIPTLTFTAYATKENYENSDIATVTLCWIPCTENHGDDVTEVITIPAKPVLIQTDGGTITVNGLADGTVVKVNDLNGVELGTAIATGGTATITTSLTAGSVAVVQMGNHTIKVVIK